MDTPPLLTPRELVTHIISDMANAVSERPGESAHQRATRVQAAVQTILAFSPHDPFEAMLAGHCVMIHETIVDSIRHTLRGDEDPGRRAARGSIVAMDKAFGNNLARLERYRTHRAEASPQAQPTLALAETDIADRSKRHQSQSPAHQPPVSAQAPSPEAIAARAATGEATAPLHIAAPPPFALSRGIDPPCGDWPAGAAVQMSGYNGQAAGNSSQTQPPAYAGNRQARRHPNR